MSYDRAFNYLLDNFDYKLYSQCFKRAVIDTVNHITNNN